MIVETDFLDHWKTQLLVTLTGDKTAPLMLVRLWAHCQTRKRWIFQDMSNAALKAICRWDGDENNLRGILEECKFLDKNDGAIVVHEWDKVNAYLVKNWFNGSCGGRPKKPTDNPAETQTVLGILSGSNVGTQGKPSDNPAITQREPIDKIREEKRRIPPNPHAGDGFITDFSEQLKVRLGGIKNRKPSTKWSDKEDRALKKLLPLDPREVVLLEWFYSLPEPSARSKSALLYRRKDLFTLLNNWPGEVDRAKEFWASFCGDKPDFNSEKKKERGAPAPEDWQQAYCIRFGAAMMPGSWDKLSEVEREGVREVQERQAKEVSRGDAENAERKE